MAAVLPALALRNGARMENPLETALARDLSIAEAADLWQEVARQVEKQALALGTYADLPPQRRGDGSDVRDLTAARGC